MSDNATHQQDDSNAISTSTPPIAPWALSAAYVQPLPPALRFNTNTGFTAMSDWICTLPESYPSTPLRICPVVATYPSGAIKKTWTNQKDLTPAEIKEYTRGVPLSVAVKHWTKRGTVGVVTSSLSSASAQSQGANDWHTVAMARCGNTVWVHDPGYDGAVHAGAVKRVDGVHGTGMIHRLVQQWPQVKGVYFQGPPSSYNLGEMECMGRSAQWVEATVAGTLPWPPNQDSSGGLWTWHSRN